MVLYIWLLYARKYKHVADDGVVPMNEYFVPTNEEKKGWPSAGNFGFWG